jgi:hypothetical protein
LWNIFGNLDIGIDPSVVFDRIDLNKTVSLKFIKNASNFENELIIEGSGT